MRRTHEVPIRVQSVSADSLKKHVDGLLDAFKKDDNKVLKETGTEEELDQLVSARVSILLID